MKNENIKLLYIDLFAGAGGVTTGVEEAEIKKSKIAKVIVAVNHDQKAIESHAANHPETHHFIEDIKTLDVSKLIPLVEKARKEYPKAFLVLWASLECTNFSNAKGGKPKDADSRTLANHLFRYIKALNPDYIQIENVREFMSWGEIDSTGKPISKDKGKDYIKWVEKVKSFGYSYDWRLLDAANFGAYTTRTRFFGQFAKGNNRIVWPDPTHSKNPSSNLFDQMKPWRPVKDVLDFSSEGKSIFNRIKPLSDKTYERILHGLIKFVSNGDKEFISKYFSGKPKHKNASINSPSHAITTKDRHSLIQCFMTHYYGNGYNSSVESPSNSLTTKDRISLVQCFVDTKFPKTELNSQTTKDQTSLVWLDRNFSNAKNSNLEEPSGSVPRNPTSRLIRAFIMNTNFNNIGQTTEKPLSVITANRKWHYLVNPSWGGNTGSIDKPCCVVVARQDKAPLYLITTNLGSVSVPIYDDDSPMVIEVKKVMALLGITDIKMRMLSINELKLITGFSKDYKLVGTQTDQKKFIGNAVPTQISKAITESLAEFIIGSNLSPSVRFEDKIPLLKTA